MSAADYMRHCKYKKYFTKTQICERLFTKRRLFILKFDDTIVVFVINNDTIGSQLPGLLGCT